MLRKFIMVNWQQQIGYEMTQQRVLRSTISQLVYQSVYPGLKISKLKIKDILFLLNHSVSSKMHFLSEDKACIFSSLFIDTRKSIAFHQLTNYVCMQKQLIFNFNENQEDQVVQLAAKQVYNQGKKQVWQTLLFLLLKVNHEVQEELVQIQLQFKSTINVGCIPKKLFHVAAQLGDYRKDQGKGGWSGINENDSHNWNQLVQVVNNMILRLKKMLENNFKIAGQ
ncbi:unnamed protein product [Paramecium pentaurelia]|uniref:Uncharacterized protein n=1 Tax=Paramecium pentaurelia TaxID=43138 RepID=A0A8S1XLK4_9CILI|nr:unnamed protein product [Paramecium pentaurelia]